MQLAIVEFARNVIGFHDAHSLELNPSTTHPVIHIMQDQIGIEDIGGTLRWVLIHVFWTKLPKHMRSTRKKKFRNATDIAMKSTMITVKF